MSTRPIQAFNLRERIDIAPATVPVAPVAPVPNIASNAARTAQLPSKLRVNLPVGPKTAEPKPSNLPTQAAQAIPLIANQFKFQLSKANAPTMVAKPQSPTYETPTTNNSITTTNTNTTINATNGTTNSNANNSATLRLVAQLEDMTSRQQRSQKLADVTSANLRQTATLLITERKEHQAAIAQLNKELATASEVEARLKQQLAERPAKKPFDDQEFSSKVAAAVDQENAITAHTSQLADLEVQLTTLGDRKVVIAAEITALETLRDAASEKLEELRTEHRAQRSIVEACSAEHKELVAQKASLVQENASLREAGANLEQVNSDLTLRKIAEEVAKAKAELAELELEKTKKTRQTVDEDVWDASAHVAAEVIEPPNMEANIQMGEDAPAVNSVLEAPQMDAQVASAPTRAVEEPLKSLEPLESSNHPAKAESEPIMVTHEDLIQLEQEVTLIEAEVAMDSLANMVPHMDPLLPSPLLPLNALSNSDTNAQVLQTPSPPVFTPVYTPINRPKSIHHLMPKVASRSGIAAHLPRVDATMAPTATVGSGKQESPESQEAQGLIEAVLYDLRARFNA